MIKQVSRVFAAAAMLAACTQPSAPPVVGGDRDAHGCIGSAGYSWCAREALCVRPWELAGQRGFANEANAFDAYCAASPN